MASRSPESALAGALVIVALCAVAILMTPPQNAEGRSAVTNFRLPGNPLAGEVARGKLWVLVLRSGRRELVEIRPSTGRPTGRRVTIQKRAGSYSALVYPSKLQESLAVAGGKLWTVDHSTGEVVMVDPVSAKVAERIDIGGHAGALAYGIFGLWATDLVPERFSRGGRDGYRWRIVGLSPSPDPGALRISGELTVAGYSSIGNEEWSIGPRRLAVTSRRLNISLPDSSGLGVARTVAPDRILIGSHGGWRMKARRGVLVSAPRYGCGLTVTGKLDGRPEFRSTPPSRSVQMLKHRRQRRCVLRAVGVGPAPSIWGAYLVRRRGIISGVLVRTSVKSGATRRYAIGRDPVDVVSGSGPWAWALSGADRRLTRIRLRG